MVNVRFLSSKNISVIGERFCSTCGGSEAHRAERSHGMHALVTHLLAMPSTNQPSSQPAKQAGAAAGVVLSCCPRCITHIHQGRSIKLLVWLTAPRRCSDQSATLSERCRTADSEFAAPAGDDTRPGAGDDTAAAALSRMIITTPASPFLTFVQGIKTEVYVR
jgi:hypothetical protein